MRQITNTIMMIRPANFGYNAETAENNSFQTLDDSLSNEQIKAKAIEEFDGFVANLRQAGIEIIVVQDSDLPQKPDAVFPNNWISFHEEGMIIQYPMYAKARRIERRQEIVDQISAMFQVDKDYTFEHYEEEDMFLEGTGSMILDRENQVVYANLSPRTDLRLLNKWAVLMRYKVVHFYAKDRQGEDIYHTNVMMALGRDFCIICLDSITDQKEKAEVVAMLENSEKTIIPISYDQMESFAGNMLQVASNNGTSYLVMSSTAYQSLLPKQIAQIETFTNILTGEIPTIEKYGGGSVRCMMAEVFLKRLPK